MPRSNDVADSEDDAADVVPRPFSVDLYPRSIDSGELDRRFPPHRLVLEPLIAAAVEVTVHGGDDSATLPSPPGVRKRTVLHVDLGGELVKGLETFWNASTWKRGAVLITAARAKVDWAELFSWTQYGSVSASRHQIAKSMPVGAIRRADAMAQGDRVVVVLSASNGIQWADVWAAPESCRELDALAQTHCQRFVRAVEVGKYEREIVYDREPYASLV